MFTAEDIQRRLKRQPFIPLRIITSAGEYYDITHPDLVLVGRRELIVGTASAKNPSVFDRHSLIAALHITAIEDLTPDKAPGNGQQPT